MTDIVQFQINNTPQYFEETYCLKTLVPSKYISFDSTFTFGHLTKTNCLVYVDMGNQATDTTTLTFAFTTTTTTRNWEIKVTQIECSNPSR